MPAQPLQGGVHSLRLVSRLQLDVAALSFRMAGAQVKLSLQGKGKATQFVSGQRLEYQGCSAFVMEDHQHLLLPADAS